MLFLMIIFYWDEYIQGKGIYILYIYIYIYIYNYLRFFIFQIVDY